MEPGQWDAGAAGHHPNGKGGILYCVVARGATVLARCSKSVTRFKKNFNQSENLIFPRHASCVGNFAEISDLVLAKVGFSPKAFN